MGWECQGLSGKSISRAAWPFVPHRARTPPELDLCPRFPLQCDQFVAEYEPVLIEILVEVMDPSFVCLVSLTGWCGSSRAAVT